MRGSRFFSNLGLETGTIDRQATYESGSGTNSLIFAYTVQNGDLSSGLDYISTTALSLNGAVIQNLPGDDAILTLPGVGTPSSLSGQTDLVIDGVRPTVLIDISQTALTAGETMTVTFTFSEPVTEFDNADLTMGNGTLSPVNTEDAGITWTATFTPASGVEAASNVITIDNSGYSDAAGNEGTGTTDSDNYLKLTIIVPMDSP